MKAPFALVAEPTKQLTAREEVALLERALAQRDSPTTRLKLALLQNRLDDFAKTIALLDSAGPPADFATAKALAAARLARGAAEDFEPALAVAQAAEALADCDVHRAEALVDQARVWLRTGNPDTAAQLASAALERDPANRDALQLLSGQWLATGQAERVLALSADISAKGAAHIQLLGIQAQALAQRGEIDAARELTRLDHWLFQSSPPAPEGWADLPSFHTALTRELLESPALRNGRHATASVATLRVDEPATATTPALRALQQLIIAQTRSIVETLSREGHPWLVMRPDTARLQMWCVITGSNGYERWHMHPLGWASGGYYVEVPDAVQHDDSPAGCLAFGLPDQPIGRTAAESFGTRLVRPYPGLLNLFPSHAYHRTYPHGANGRRICIAYDLIPQ